MTDFKFSTLEYKRPDFEALSVLLDQMVEDVKNASSYAELKKVMARMEQSSNDFSTDCVIASIRNTLDTRDEFYEKEQEYIDEMMPVITPKFLAVDEALMNSPFKADIEKEYGKQYFAQKELQKKTAGFVPKADRNSCLAVS